MGHSRAGRSLAPRRAPALAPRRTSARTAGCGDVQCWGHGSARYRV